MTALALALYLAAAPTNDLETALGRPLSPGAVALLLEHSPDARARERIAAALRLDSAPTRAAAARVAQAGAMVGLAPVLIEALAVEVDPEAAQEQGRALLTLDPRSDEAVITAARRLGGPVLTDMGLALAAARGGAAVPRLEELRAAGFPPEKLERFLEHAARKDPVSLSLAGVRALREGDTRLWQALLAASRTSQAAVDPGLLASALGGRDDFRAAALEHLVLAFTPASSRPAALAGALEALRAATPPSQRTLAFQLIDRFDQATALDLTTILGSVDDELSYLLVQVYSQPRLRELLSPAEREAARKRIAWPAGPVTNPFLSPDERRPKGGTLMQLANGYPRGLVQDLLAASGCKVDRKHMLGALIRRDTAGRPVETAAYKDLAGGPSCIVAAYALGAMHLNDLSEPPSTAQREIVLLPLDPDVLACGDSRPEGPTPPTAAGRGPARRIGGQIKEPRKVRSVAPRYPDSIVDRRVSGLVILDATITVAGCVSALRVVHGADPLLDVEALRAVSAWRYTPTLLDGVPVPVAMTVTVNFKLR